MVKVLATVLAVSMKRCNWLCLTTSSPRLCVLW